MTIIQLDGYRTGNRKIAERVAAERARVESFNRHMTMAMMPHRTAMWRGVLTRPANTFPVKSFF